MEQTATFTITADNGQYNIKSKAYNLYNQYNISRDCLFATMYRLADIFNNVLKIGIVFEVE